MMDEELEARALDINGRGDKICPYCSGVMKYISWKWGSGNRFECVKCHKLLYECEIISISEGW